MCYSFIPRKFTAQPDSSETKTPAEMRQAAPADKPAAVRSEQAARQSYDQFMEKMRRWMEQREEENIRP